MDLDRLVATHRADWDRLRQLTRSSRLSGAEADEFVDLYGRASTDLSILWSEAPDPALVAELSTLVARARGTTTGTRRFTTDDITRYFVVTFPLLVYRARWWVAGVTLGFLLVAFALGAWVAANPDVQGALAPPAYVDRLVNEDFESYYSSDPAASFGAKVWTNNVWVAALSLAFGGLLGLPVLWVLWQNASNVGVVGGFMAANGRLDLFFGLILPHGLLELTAVFVASALGLRLGWTLIAPGQRMRADAFASEGRSTLSAVVGLSVVLLISGVIEAFVTPSGLPTLGRILIGVLALASFLTYVAVLGRRADRAGLGTDLGEDDIGSTRPVAA
ncbi:MAG: stage II sporulation protein M [Actinomycetia bacterium]|nr:stage II sporulation protein M [Actinomycetes bacterium]